MISIIIPHLSRPLNDEALELTLDRLERWTFCRYEVLIPRELECPYKLWNRYVDQAKYENIVFSNSDVIMSPGWEGRYLEFIDDNSIVCPYLIEPNVIGVAPVNIQRDFGRTPKEFIEREWAYLDWVRNSDHARRAAPMRLERAWYMPCMMRKSLFDRLGRFETEKPFPEPNDIKLWDKAVAMGVALKRVSSYAYHFQNLSNPEHDHKRRLT